MKHLPSGRIPDVGGQGLRGLAGLTDAEENELQKVLYLSRR